MVKLRKTWDKISKHKKMAFAVVIGFSLIIGFGLLLDKSLDFLDDGGEGGIPVPTASDGGLPTFWTPSFSLVTVEVYDIVLLSFNLKFYVLHVGNVDRLDATFNVDGVLNHIDTLSIPITGWFDGTFYKTAFSGYESGSEITIDLSLTYTHPDLGTKAVMKRDVADAFTFYETIPTPTPPVYFEPEILEGSFEYTLLEPNIDFSFATVNFEHISNIKYYFVFNNEIVQNNFGIDLVYTMITDGNGAYSTTFDYTQFDLNGKTAIYLIMNFEDESGSSEERIYEKYAFFGYNVTTPLASIGFETIVFGGLLIISIIVYGRKRKGDMK